MSASHQEISNVKNFLKQQFISISFDWVQACISFIKEEHANLTLSFENLKNLVYQQWLDADLEEIGVSSLPQQLPTAQKITLNGCFALQVDGIRDVGRPAYAQLKELDQNVNSNAEFSSAPEQTLPLVLEGIIGISALAMVKMQLQAATNPEMRKEVMEAISKCKVTLQECNCLMDVHFPPDSKPCLVKVYPINELHIQQLRKRIELNS
ncbi:recQ-mediated genome instability protein 1 [Nephila pilipes]|uniref:RecQ-mediated genome instability protein 1 n=1 Tax=Nephila pilipes TaxID=299642 RepID=A0A8X6Q2T0_NEPPI|nr:recQ-mediated genome instability protein 1 [Nephila pilipes]